MQQYINHHQLEEMEQRKRVHLINSIGGFKSVCLIGTTNSEQQNNLAIFNSLVHLGANPPLVGIIFRTGSTDRHTLSNILETGFYTINHIHQDIYTQAHQTSARYPKEISEFEAVNLNPVYQNNFLAPFVKESFVQIGLAFRQRIDISLNNTCFVIGEIIQLYFPDDCLCEDGFVDIEKAGSLTCSGLDSYHQTQRLDRLSYAKPNQELNSLPVNYLV
jgi:flavin reductase (DIM6/NTAB) family NADH-FMN oxidoreductase RutF